MDDARALAERLRERAANHLGEFYTAAVDRVLDLAAADLLDRLAAPEGVGLTRYSIVRGFLHEDVDGEWVRHEDAAMLFAAARAASRDVVAAYEDAVGKAAKNEAALAASTAREKVKDEEIERLREALESSAGKPDYTAWLVEPINVEIGVHYLSLSPAVVGYWTTNADLALHFARRIDAEQWLEHQDTISRCKVQVVEHTWPRAVLSGRKPDKEGT